MPGGQMVAHRLIDLFEGYSGEASDPVTHVAQYYEERVASHTDQPAVPSGYAGAGSL